MNNDHLDYKKYLKSIIRSQLAEDILQYDEVDLFNVGPEGSKLSGGQKQRLSICRALYNDKEIFLLDDPFSSLDPHVSDKVFSSAISGI